MTPHSYRNFAEPLVINAEGLPEFLAFIYIDDRRTGAERSVSEALDERALGVADDLLTSAHRGDRALLLLPPGLDLRSRDIRMLLRRRNPDLGAPSTNASAGAHGRPSAEDCRECPHLDSHYDDSLRPPGSQRDSCWFIRSST